MDDNRCSTCGLILSSGNCGIVDEDQGELVCEYCYFSCELGAETPRLLLEESQINTVGWSKLDVDLQEAFAAF
jgi:hypothetical protein